MARRKLHLDPSAEKEAVEVGQKFMNSSDVVGDMSRTYGADLSSVRIHTDEGAAAQAAQRGVDAFSTGTDVFFGRGAFDRSDPASRGLLAHELSHSLQQGVGGGSAAMTQSAPEGAAQGGLLDWFRGLFRSKPKPEEIQFGNEPGVRAGDIGKMWRRHNASGMAVIPNARRTDLVEYLNQREGTTAKGRNRMVTDLGNASGSVTISGLGANRMASTLKGAYGGDADKDEIGQMYDDLLAGEDVREMEDKSSVSQETMDGLDARFDRGFLKLKGMAYDQLKRLRDKYGTYGSQMHPEDFLSRAGRTFFDDMTLLQDSEQMMVSGGKYFDMENSAEDQEFKQLSDYYNDLYQTLQGYIVSDKNQGQDDKDFEADGGMVDFVMNMDGAKGLQAKEAGIKGPGMNWLQQKLYNHRLKKRFKKEGKLDRLFGRFK